MPLLVGQSQTKLPVMLSAAADVISTDRPNAQPWRRLRCTLQGHGGKHDRRDKQANRRNDKQNSQEGLQLASSRSMSGSAFSSSAPLGSGAWK